MAFYSSEIGIIHIYAICVLRAVPLEVREYTRIQVRNSFSKF